MQGMQHFLKIINWAIVVRKEKKVLAPTFTETDSSFQKMDFKDKVTI